MLHTVTQYLRISVKKYPDRVALIDQKISLTYAELFDEVEHIAYEMVRRNCFKKPVAVLMDKGARTISAFLGVALSGNFYTVIDTKMPQNRVEKILETFEPLLFLVDKKNEKKAAAFGIDYVVYEELIDKPIEVDERSIIQAAEKRIIDTDILYVLFTSGSTGIPKGVIITHRSVIDYTEWVGETFHLDHNSIIGNQAPFYFDNSVLDIYSTIRNGATLHVIPQMLYSFPIRLLEYIRDNKINTIFWVPTVLCRVADLNLLDKCEIDCLDKVLFAGEVMPARQLNAWIRRLPKATFANLYGPTEITVDCTYYIVDREIKDDESVPIGYACMNSDVIVLNEKNELVGPNEKGELCVRGSSLSLGYYNNPDKTAAAFVQNPLNNVYHELIYRTGDIVHYNDRGEIIYDGRRDNQIKHTGHRIELGEIETAVFSNALIRSNCCLHDALKDLLVIFYVGDIGEEELRKYLNTMLPEYMIPNVYCRLESMPLNMNGKIDRMKLKEQIGE
jgi:amino acid adenylation domain-containing protein